MSVDVGLALVDIDVLGRPTGGDENTETVHFDQSQRLDNDETQEIWA